MRVLLVIERSLGLEFINSLIHSFNMYHGTHVEVRKQISGVREFQGSNSGQQASQQAP